MLQPSLLVILLPFLKLLVFPFQQELMQIPSSKLLPVTTQDSTLMHLLEVLFPTVSTLELSNQSLMVTLTHLQTLISKLFWLVLVSTSM
jgi:hypothetical protein